MQNKGKQASMIKKKYLISPGPTPIPESVLSAAAEPIIHHRTPEFSHVFMEVTRGLQYMFQTKEDVFILASTGTGAMEAAVVNLLSPEDEVIVLNGGKFGNRWACICREYGLKTRDIKIEWGKDYPKEKLRDELSIRPGFKAVFTTLSETSTGAVYDIKGYSEVIKDKGGLLVVDGISGIGAVPCPMDDWNIDVLIAGSQKAFMIPPGLSYIAFSPKAWACVEKSSLPKYYFDAKSAKKSLKNRTSPYSPAISLIIQQKKALEIIMEIGLEKLIEHHTILGKATRAGVTALGLELLADNPGNVLTAVKTPKGIDGFQIIDTMHSKYGVYIAGSQAPHKGEFFRISHLGYISRFDIITALSALEMTLSDLGYKCEFGESLKAAEKILKEEDLL
ncbi:MAG TPA: alanine--glyoxylate aminotransferase family protein [Candidatus Aminicenantes bacterium]|nr:alanine--glyoxylate aminotransferase family protein [Candidatus Aminicenantes bacterium]